MTHKIYYEDAYIREFEAQVVSCEKAETGYRVTLDRTAFYPEGGGQPCDLGEFAGLCRILDVREDDGEVVHLCDKPLNPGTLVTGRLDWQRRLTNMREHSGEHIISGIICRRNGLDNIGFHMGKDYVTIDFNGLLSEEQIAEAEMAANETVLEDVEIISEYPDQDSLARLEYRSKKELEGAVRIVTVPGSDVCACCGTHVKRTGEIGPVKVIGSEHFKNGVRLNIVIGKKALDHYRNIFENNRKISALLSAKPEQTGPALKKLIESMNSLKLEYGALKLRFLEQKAEMVEKGSRAAILFEHGMTPPQLQKLADMLHDRAAFAAVFSGDDAAGYHYCICSAKMDMVVFGREFNQALDGRGGGKNPMIQGFLKSARAEIERYLTERGLQS